jgi:hypothetical protein
MTANRVTEKLAAAANNFRSGAVREVEAHQPSKAEAMGLKPPMLSNEAKAGLAAQAALASSRLENKIAAQAAYKQERLDYEKQRDDAIWQQIRERQRAAIG